MTVSHEEGSSHLEFCALVPGPANAATGEKELMFYSTDLKPDVAHTNAPKLFLRLSFGVAIFVSAFLLFQVQLLMGKFLLPWFGGTSGIWATCLLFFQVLLLGGYFYAHRISRLSHLAGQGRTHLAFLALTSFCIVTAWLETRSRRGTYCFNFEAVSPRCWSSLSFAFNHRTAFTKLVFPARSRSSETGTVFPLRVV